MSDPSSPVGCQVGHIQIGLVLATSYLNQIGIHWNFRPNHCLELFFMNLGPGCTVHPGHCHWGESLPLNGVLGLQRCFWWLISHNIKTTNKRTCWVLTQEWSNRPWPRAQGVNLPSINGYKQQSFHWSAVWAGMESDVKHGHTQPASNHVPASTRRLGAIGWQLILHMSETRTAELIGLLKGNENVIGSSPGWNTNEAVWIILITRSCSRGCGWIFFALSTFWKQSLHTDTETLLKNIRIHRRFSLMAKHI